MFKKSNKDHGGRERKPCMERLRGVGVSKKTRGEVAMPFRSLWGCTRSRYPPRKTGFLQDFAQNWAESS